ncbi:MAG: hypothetical protein HUJ25_01530 [Crocinitomicaceae bacterium]|nr:hypothetical protein [Crocinitomicaceae bacterium]
MARLSIFLIVLTFIACQGSEQVDSDNNTGPKESSDFLTNNTPVDFERLKHIRYLYSKYPEIELPFHYKTQGSTAVTEFMAEYGTKDTLIFGDAVPCSIIGIRPDTSQFFGFFYLVAADDAAPSVVTYDKNGNLIENKILTRSCWQGCESDCRSIIDIDTDYNIVFRYEYFEFDFNPDDNDCQEMPFEANGYIEYSHLSSDGKIILDKVDSLLFEELMKDPILHNK